MNNKKFFSIPPLLENCQTITDPKHKSELFKKHFASKYTVPNSCDNVPVLPEKPHLPSYDQINTSPIKLSKILRESLKKSHSSYCGIPGKFYQ